MLWNLKDQSKKSARNMSYKKTCMHWLQSLNVSNQQREIFWSEKVFLIVYLTPFSQTGYFFIDIVSLF